MITIKYSSKLELRKIIEAGRRASKKNIVRQAALVRTIARRSIRRTKKSSLPGAPPRSHRTGNQGIKYILYHYNELTQSAIIGPVKFGGVRGVNVPAGLELGEPTKRYNRRLKVLETQRSQARPFMRPSLLKSFEAIPSIWKDSIK